MKIALYDVTLREGAQTAGVVFSDYEKIRITELLDGLGADFIEEGFYGAGSCAALDALASGIKCSHSVLSVLCATRRAGCDIGEDEVLASVAASPYKAVAVVGKASLSQVKQILGTTADENLRMIKDTVEYLHGAGKRVFFDAEHFFDGYSSDPDYACLCARTAADAGAETVVLCDTNGGTLPDVIGYTVESVKKRLPDVHLGIHCHNDIGMADAGSVTAVISGADHVQCTVCGIGERCGNSNLTTVLPVLQVKLGFECVPKDSLSTLSSVSRKICQTANIGFNEGAPFVGGHAFLHKAGLHIDAVRKNPASFEHVAPEITGNRRSLIVSELAGKSALREFLEKEGYGSEIETEKLGAVSAAIRSAEDMGRQFDTSEASLQLLIGYALGRYGKPFEVLDYKLHFSADAVPENRWSAIVKILSGGVEQLRVAEGDGPVNALDIAAHYALAPEYPCINRIRMVDIKARIDSNDIAASASIVRVFVEYGDGESVWRTMGASTDIIAASWQALVDSYEYYILSNGNK